MPVSDLDAAKRAFVKLIKEIAKKYDVAVSLRVCSSDTDVLNAYKSTARRAHPDKGGALEDMQKLIGARETWDAAREANRGAGRPSECKQQRARASQACHRPIPVALPIQSDREALAASDVTERRSQYRFRGAAGMLTFQGLKDVQHWRDLIAEYKGVKSTWRVLRWCATLEEAPKTKSMHVHIMIQFREAIDRLSESFARCGIKPNMSANDLCGGSLRGRFPQMSVDRGMFHVWADKEGTVRDESGSMCVAGNYCGCSKSQLQLLSTTPP